MSNLERMILQAARVQLRYPKLRMVDIIEWSVGGEVLAENDTEIVITVPPGVQVCVLKVYDKRPQVD